VQRLTGRAQHVDCDLLRRLALHTLSLHRNLLSAAGARASSAPLAHYLSLVDHSSISDGPLPARWKTSQRARTGHALAWSKDVDASARSRSLIDPWPACA